VPLVGNISIYHNATTYYSKTTVGHCKIELNNPIIVIVIIFNSSKAVSMVVAAWNLTAFPLVALGGAVASFLRDPDPTTNDTCIILK
jgi:hypothetical protein